MWAAYKGYSSCVDLFLRWGANVYAVDDQGFTALHWALVKGSQGSIQKLLEYGADRYAKNNDGKTPAVTAEEMNTTRQWHRALSEAGFDRNGNPKRFPILGVKDTRWFLSRFIFFLPFVILFQALFLASHYPAFIGIPAALIVAYVVQMGAQKLLHWGPPNMRSIHHSVSEMLICVLAMGLMLSSRSYRAYLRARYSGLGCDGPRLLCLVGHAHIPRISTSNVCSNDSHQLFPQLDLCSVLWTHGVFLFPHHDV